MLSLPPVFRVTTEVIVSRISIDSGEPSGVFFLVTAGEVFPDAGSAVENLKAFMDSVVRIPRKHILELY